MKRIDKANDSLHGVVCVKGVEVTVGDVIRDVDVVDVELVVDPAFNRTI